MSSRTGRTDINDLYFGVLLWDPSSRIFKQCNLFDFLRVKRSVAIYKTHPELFDSFGDLLFALYGDTSGRVQYEFGMTDPVDGSDSIKIDIYRAYVEPNRGYLLSLAQSVTVASARRWLKEQKHDS